MPFLHDPMTQTYENLHDRGSNVCGNAEPDANSFSGGREIRRAKGSGFGVGFCPTGTEEANNDAGKKKQTSAAALSATDIRVISCIRISFG